MKEIDGIVINSENSKAPHIVSASFIGNRMIK